MSSPRSNSRPEWSWALYDWANSAFATTVIAGFFPVFFNKYWSLSTDGSSTDTSSTLWLGIGNSTASLLIFLLAPILGAVSDVNKNHVQLLAAFAFFGITCTLALSAIGQGLWPIAIVVYALAIIGFSGANVFYDALLPRIVPAESQHRVSALGFALGYLGGGVLFSINVAMTLQPAMFGLANATEAVRWSFVSVGVWWLIFMLPILRLKPHEKTITQGSNTSESFTLYDAYRKPLNTLAKIRRHKNLWWFLLAYWFYIDGVATIVRMAVDFGLNIGLPSNSLIIALLIVQFVGFPTTIAFGRLAKRYGALPGLWIGLMTYVFATACATLMTTTTHFYILAATLGLVQGGVSSLSRSIFSQLIPKHQSGEYFGFLSMLGKSAAIIGPVMVGVINEMTGNPRIGLLSIITLFVVGMFFLWKVKDPAVNSSDNTLLSDNTS